MTGSGSVYSENFAKYVTFKVGDERFGVHIEVVQQIIRPPRITPIPRTPDFFLGVLNLRGETISTVDLRQRFGLSHVPRHDNQRVLIVDYAASRLGLLVDQMGEVVNVQHSQIRLPPPLVDPNTLEFLTGAVHFENDESLLLLDQERLIKHEDFLTEVKVMKEKPSGQQSGELIVAEAEQVFVGFRLADEYYVLEISDVEEIIRFPTLIKVPQSSHNIEGVFHLRNQVIPLLSLTRRFGLRQSKITETTYVLVVNVQGTKVGLMVDQIRGVLRIKPSKIGPLPKNVTGHKAAHLQGIVQIPAEKEHYVYMVILLNQIFSETELERLSQFQYEEELEYELPEEDNDEEIISLIRFKIGNEIYAIRLLQVNHITSVPPSLVFSVPKCPTYVKGVINVRGEIITVIDLPRMFESPNSIPKNDHVKIIVVNIGERKVGLQVEDIVGITYLSNTIFDIPEHWGEESDHRIVEAIGREESGDVTVLLDLEATLMQATGMDRIRVDSEAEPFSGFST
ncbi:chemotaxis protein CheW [Deltaproteobacteria bacterium TL4]